LEAAVHSSRCAADPSTVVDVFDVTEALVGLRRRNLTYPDVSWFSEKPPVGLALGRTLVRLPVGRVGDRIRIPLRRERRPDLLRRSDHQALADIGEVV